MTRKAESKANGAPLPVEANLSWAAAKLYIHLIRMQGGYENNAELMRNTRIGDHRTYRAALAQLRDAGLIDAETGHVRVLGVVTATVGQSGAAAFGRGGGGPTAMWETWYTDARKADEMPSDGAHNQPSSNFQKRRRKQVEVIQTAWRATFPESADMTRDAVKRCLRLLTPDAEGEEAETILELIDRQRTWDTQRGKDKGERANSVGYLIRTLQNKRKDAFADGVETLPQPLRTSADLWGEDGDVA